MEFLTQNNTFILSITVQFPPLNIVAHELERESTEALKILNSGIKQMQSKAATTPQVGSVSKTHK